MNEIKNIICDKTGLEPTEISKESFFEDDLNIGEMELIEILQELEEKLHVDLVEDRDDIASVGELYDLISEKLD